MGAVVEVSYFNSFLLKDVGKLQSSTNYESNGLWPSLPWNPDGFPTFPLLANSSSSFPYEWYVEESRIRGGFNNTSTELGPRAFLSENNDDEKVLQSTLIYSGLFNSSTDVNNTNVFSVADNITRSLDPRYGNIQFIHARDTDLTVFQQSRISRALIDKDALYTQTGTSNVVAVNSVIGTIVPYEGDYGISDQPESFAYYGFRRYFSDVNRGAIMRLSRDGLSEISNFGMSDFFRDKLGEINNRPTTFTVVVNITSISGATAVVDDVSNLTLGMQLVFNTALVLYLTNINSSTKTITCSNTITGAEPTSITASMAVKDKILGGWDAHNKNYVLSIQRANPNPSTDYGYETLNFDDSIKGWVSFFTYKPTQVNSLKNIYYTFDNLDLYKHYSSQARNTFYNTQSSSKIEFVFNNNPSVQKVFSTVNYEGYSGWKASTVVSDETGADSNVFYNDSTNIIKSYDEGLYTDPLTGQPQRAGFNRKENLYVANLINNSSVMPGEIVFGNKISGVKGYFLTVTLETDSTTDLNGPKELFSVGSRFVRSS